VAPLVKKLRATIPNTCIVISNVTETGHEEAKKVIPDADHHVFLPLDLPYIIRPIIKSAQPDLVILSESDFWFHFQDSAKEVGAKLVLVNGKISEKSLKRYRILPWLSGQFFYSFDLVCCQTAQYRNRMMQLGILPDRLLVTGNLKLDDTYPMLTPSEIEARKQRFKINPSDPILVVGSSHQTEEKLILDALKPVWVHYPNLKVFIVPRKPERFDAVAALIEREGLKYVRASTHQEADEDVKVILVDQMGVLREYYQIADLALVAGSYLASVGGHNLLEPSWYGVPVIHGPHVHTQNEMAHLLKERGAGLQVEPQELSSMLITLLGNKSKCEEMGRAGKQIFEEASGASERTWESIRALL
jgi:3-deoxy-D-manno-octulosonic-acid transferase